jgi:nucleoid-associated protein YgaU
MRLLRPLWWLAAATGALVGFVALGGLVDAPLQWGDVGGWLDEVPLEDALVELARWLGMALAVYVIVVAVLVLLSELAAGMRAVPLARGLRRLAGVVAVPALRRRLVEASTATAITVSAMTATLGHGASAVAPAAATQTVDTASTSAGVMTLPAGVSPADVSGFGEIAATPSDVPGTVRVTVQRGDTVWDLAVAQYGFCDATIVDLIATASGLSDPNLIFVGQVLVLPSVPSATPVAPPPDPPVVAVPRDAATWATHTIVYGDTTWDILKGFYGYVDGDLVWAVADYNQIENPSDIPVGTVITLPPLDALFGVAPTPPESTAPSTVPLVEAPSPAVDPAAPLSSDDSAEPTVPPPVEEAPPASMPVEATAPVEPSPVSDQAPLPASDPSASAPAAHVDEGWTAAAPWFAGLAGATTLSVGLLGVYRRLRRRQSAAGARAWRLMPSGQSARLHRHLEAAADLPLVRWASQELSGVLFGLGRPAAGPVAVELSDLTGIELLWDAPMPDPPAPWEATPGGWSWRLLYDPAAEVPQAALPAAVPALVTFGRRHDAQVLIDLEAFGTVSIIGDPRAAEDVMRSVVLEFGSGEELSDAWVSTVGLGVDGVEHLTRVQRRSDADAVAHASGIVTAQRQVMDEAGVAGTFVLRAAGPPAAREVTVVAVRAESCAVLDELAELAAPRSGLVVVALGELGGAGLRVDVDAAGAMQLDPLGMVLDAIGVSHEAAANAAVLLDSAAASVTVEELLSPDDEGSTDGVDTGDERAEELSPGVVAEVAALCDVHGVDLIAAGDLLAGEDPAEWERPTASLTVRVLGAPRLDPDRELSRLERMVIVYLASAGGHAPASALRDAVWGGSLISDKRFSNLLGRLRAELGAGVLPPRSSVPNAEVRLEDAVTDLELFEALASQAERVPSSAALPLLLEALGLVFGPPFDDLGYDWAIDRQLQFRAASAIEAAALRAVELALAGDDVVAARAAISMALVGLPGNELLYRARMRIEAHAGNRAGVRTVYAELLNALEELSGDSGDSADPSPATRQLYEQLVDSSRHD